MKTRMETLAKTYLNIADIQRLLCLSWAKAKLVYQMADEIDSEELGNFRIEPHKVRCTSVFKVTGTNFNLLQKQIKAAEPVKVTTA